MVDVPKVAGPDGVYRTFTRFSTTLPNRFFVGTMDPSTVDMQIKIRGGAYTSDPDLILFEGDTFSFPNPSVYPEGLELAPGLNTIEVRSISFSAAVSAPAVVEATLVQESDIGVIGEPPTEIYVEQRQQAVEIFAKGVDLTSFTGINIYASRFPGGGASGYLRVNLQPITDFETVDHVETIASENIDTTLQTNDQGALAADPMFVHLTQGESNTINVVEHPEEIIVETEEEAAGAFEEMREGLLRTDFTRVIEVPENARILRTSYNIDAVTEEHIYSFSHHRQFGPASDPPTISIGEFASLSSDEPLYYVTTALYYDSVQQLEFESPFSAEVVGKPVTVLQTLGTFPAPNRQKIVQDTLGSILRTEPDLAVQPGAVIRDTVIDPFADELVRLRGLVDFIYRIQSFDTLLQIDGIEADGTSTPVGRSAYKQALARILGLQNTGDVQIIIDSAFEQLASRDNVFREGGTRARGLVTFYTSKQPTQTVSILLGTRVSSGQITFVTTAFAEIPVSDLASFFNPSTGVYSVDVAVQAETLGANGNVGPSQIRSLITTIPGFSVINRSRTFGGKNRETNQALAENARNAISSVDSGTEQGIRQKVAKLAGVEGSLVVAAGDPLMQRDFDVVRNMHMGGKADVWIRGRSEGRVTDSFAFTYDIAQNVQFVIFGNPLDFVFRALDKNLGATHPIAEMLNREDLGLGFKNATSGVFFDLTGVQILDYRTIQLSTDVPQPPVAFGDVVLGDYRYVTATDLILSRQPVSSILSVVGATTGVLAPNQWELRRTKDPLLDGRSVKAEDTLRILPDQGVPIGAYIAVQNESHLLFAFYDEFLSVLGANPLSIRVFDETKTVEYRGPSHPSGISDFTIIGGTQTRAAAIRRTQNSEIRSGQRVLVDYDHDENFTVEYTTNFVITTAQDVINDSTHITSDVLIKEVVQVPVDINATIVLVRSQTSSTVDRRIRTNIRAFLRTLPQGGNVRQADIIRLLDQTAGVSYIQLPLTQLTRAAGSQVVHETIVMEATTDATLLLGVPAVPFSSSTVRVWLFVNPLSSPTSTGGGSDANFRAVYQDDKALDLMLSDPDSLRDTAGQAFIIGNDGMIIPGYSDDATIKTKYPNAQTAQEIETIRQEITQNRVMVSIHVDDQPLGHTYKATYIVAFSPERVQDIELGSLEEFVEGTLTFTYVEDRA